MALLTIYVRLITSKRFLFDFDNFLICYYHHEWWLKIAISLSRLMMEEEILSKIISIYSSMQIKNLKNSIICTVIEQFFHD